MDTMSDKASDGQASPQKAAEDFHLPEGVIVPGSIESNRSTLFVGDVVDMLKQLPIEKINTAFDTFEYQCNLRGDEIRNRRAYLRGILKGHLGVRGGDFPRGVNVPSSIPQTILDDKDLMDVLKAMPVRDINSCFRDYDEQMKKKSDQIRNKNAYLLGIIKSGPHYNLPQGVVIPSTLSLAMLQGELLETIQELPAANINVAFSEYDEQVQKKGDTIRNRPGYLLGIIKRMKRTLAVETAEKQGSTAPGSPKKEGQTAYSPSSKNGTARSETGNLNPPLTEMAKPAINEPQGTLNLVTESFIKVTNELVIERQARNDLQDQMKQEQNRREETNQRILRLTAELANEKEQRERSALEVQRLRNDLSFERSMRENAEGKVQMLEETRVVNRAQQQQMVSGTEQEQLQRLELDLSIERALREKAEKLLQTAEVRINDLNRELKYVQDKLHEERTKLPFGTWMASLPLSSMPNEFDNEDKKTSELPPSLSGISELVSMAEFDPETFTFTNKKDSEIMQQNGSKSMGSYIDLDLMYKVYSKDEVLVTNDEAIRFLQLEIGNTSERVQVNVRVQVPGGFPGSCALIVNADVITNSTFRESARTVVEVALPRLVEACRFEASKCCGKDAVLSVLTTADYWAQNEWLELQAVQKAARAAEETEKLEICRLLLQTNAINDHLLLRHLVAKHGFGGLVKTGAPGLLLLEGLQRNSSSCMELMSKKSEPWMSFSIIGRSTLMSETLVSGLVLPRKLVPLVANDWRGLKDVCAQVGLSDALAKALS